MGKLAGHPPLVAAYVVDVEFGCLCAAAVIVISVS